MPQNRRAVVYLLSLLAASPLALASADLTVTVTAIVPATVDPRAQISVGYTVRNAGTDTAGASALQLYVTTDVAGKVILSHLPAAIAVPSLCGGCSTSGTVSRVLPASITVGSRYLFAETDVFRAVAESNETNNTSSRAFVVACQPLGSFALGGPAAGASLPPNGNPVTLSWGTVPGAEFYSVYFGFTNPPSLLYHLTVTTFDEDVTPGRRHYWTVVAKNRCGETVGTSSGTKWFDVASCVQPAQFSLLAPQNYAPLPSTTTKVKLEWSPSAGATHYTLYVGPQNPPLLPAGVLTGTSYELTVRAGALRYWRVEAQNACGVASSETRSFTVAGCTQVTAPTLIAPANGSILPHGTRSVELSWQPVTGAESYDVYMVDYGSQTLVANVPGTKYSLAPHGSRSWRVVARSCNSVATSPTWSFLIPDTASLTSWGEVEQNRAAPGTGISIFYEVNNSGPADALQSTIDFWLSADTTVTPEDRFLGSRAVRRMSSIGEDHSGSGELTATIPTDTMLGPYYVLMRADAANVVPEENEDDNTAAVPLEISHTPPDLADLAPVSVTISPQQPTDADEITITGSITNSGPKRTWRESNVTITAEGTLLVSRSAMLEPGDSVSLTWKGSLPSGTHVIALEADTESRIHESNEANNDLTKLLNVTAAAPGFGATIIIHGEQQPAPVPPRWTFTMAEAIRKRGGKGQILVYTPETGALEPCADPACGTADSGGETIIIFNWAADSGGALQGFTEAAADALSASLRTAEGTLRLAPIHIIGHGRGAVVASELAERLLASGRNVAQVTALDPVDGGSGGTIDDGDVNAPFSAEGVKAWRGGVLYDTYFSNGMGCETGTDVDGRAVRGAINRDLSRLGIGHAQVHAWYHGTIDISASSDGSGGACAAIDPAWYGGNPLDCTRLPRANDGYAYARLGSPHHGCLAADASVRVVPYSGVHPTIVNGDFARPGSGLLLPGWSFHGGGGTALVKGGVLVLDALGQQRTHNRMYIPATVERMALDLRVPVPDSGAAGAVDFLEVIVSDGTDTVVVHREDLTRTISRWEPRLFSIAPFSSRVCTVTVALRGGGAGVDAIVEIDGLRFVPPRLQRGDFDGDGSSEVLWRHAAGTLSIWDVSRGGAIYSAAFATLADANWRGLGFGDFDGDGRDDGFLRHAVTGATMMPLMNGRTIRGFLSVPTVSDTRWQMHVIGDFDGDGRDELLWRHTVSGAVAMWETDGAALAQSGVLYTAPDLNWQMVVAADFDGDGKDEVLWQHAMTGRLSMWDLQGWSFPKATLLDGDYGISIEVIGAGDFTGDGNADLLWRDPNTGDVELAEVKHVLWFKTIETSPIKQMGAEWIPARAGDFTGDGKADMLWRNAVSGDVVMWEIANRALGASTLIQRVPDLNWKPQPPAH